ncbi:hypothetical protein EEB11_17435 [Pseudotabrizicola sediminis]|uniref:N6 adenine-specific DNA methyltransferase N-terminal domain-containing protein n=1 Tax=Pseudotabrizicola sediminis TaxID=2486418 RepID=A0ABY2KLG6_9RHOB|nr:type I restriction-modification system subunit M N-terminal domain-containing protein [Pseudotabrizicola sediminis]TGD41688.1 hypothetical protein EEB11_17435 [Pseudotabrizicola sediminis]
MPTSRVSSWRKRAEVEGKQALPRTLEGEILSQDTIKTNATYIWSIAEILRGDFKQSEYGKIVLPFTVLRRFDCLLEPTKSAVLETAPTLPEETDDEAQAMILTAIASPGGQIYNESQFTFASLRGQDPRQLRVTLPPPPNPV